MSVWESRSVLLKISGDADLTSAAKRLVGMLAQSNDEMIVTVDGEAVDVAELSGIERFDSISFEFEYHSAEAYREFERLNEAIEGKGAGFGALVNYDSDFGSYVEPHGDYKTTALAAGSEDIEWGTGAGLSIAVKLDSGDLGTALGCDFENLVSPELDEALHEKGEELIGYIFGSEIAEKMNIDEDSIDGFDPEEGILTFCPEGDWCFGTLRDFAERKDVFESANQKISEAGGSLAIYWNLEGADTVRENTLVANDGTFAELKFQTGPGYWGDFTATKYSLDLD